MKTMTLVARHLYFGMDPLRLRDAANRILSRVPDDVSVGAAVKLDALIEDLHLTPAASTAIIDEMVQSGVLTKLPPSGSGTHRGRDSASRTSQARRRPPLSYVHANYSRLNLHQSVKLQENGASAWYGWWLPLAMPPGAGGSRKQASREGTGG